MKIIVTGGTGFVGRPLVTRLLAAGRFVVLLTRDPLKSRVSDVQRLKAVQWDANNNGAWASELDGADAVINLTGESVAAKRWSPAQKKKIIESRLSAAKAIVDAIGVSAKKPAVLVNASAVGYYGDVPDLEVTEKSPKGRGFLADTCERWENEALRARTFGTRVVLARIGVVIDKDGGALRKFIPPFQFFAGGPLGSGKQWFPWVHREDVIEAILFCLKNPALSGPVNVTAPEAVTMGEFCRALGRAMHRPSWAPVPAFALRILLGEMSEMILTGQKAVPAALQKTGFMFKHPSLSETLASVLK